MPTRLFASLGVIEGEVIVCTKELATGSISDCEYKYGSWNPMNKVKEFHQHIHHPDFRPTSLRFLSVSS